MLLVAFTNVVNASKETSERWLQDVHLSETNVDNTSIMKQCFLIFFEYGSHSLDLIGALWFDGDMRWGGT